MKPSRDLPLLEEVHLYRFDLDREAAETTQLLESLSQDERERAARYHFPKDRDRFIVGRGLLRLVLGEYLGCEPAVVRFGYSPHGKPHLADNDTLQFNLSHSHDIGLLAVTWGCAVGIDIERIRTDMPLEAMASGVFSPKEQERLLALPTEDERRAYFFTLWALKEAFVKGLGEGITHPLQEFTITYLPDGSATLEYDSDGGKGEGNCWHLQRLSVGKGYCAAVACACPSGFLTSPPWCASTKGVRS